MLCAVRRWLFYATGINFDVIICVTSQPPIQLQST